jgi:hypothetical protein
MIISIRTPKTELPREQRRILDRRARLGLARVAHRIRAVRLRITDDNGPKGGVDHRCLVEARLRPSGRVHVHARDLDPVSAGTAAIRRLGRRIRRELDRRRFGSRTTTRRRAPRRMSIAS